MSFEDEVIEVLDDYEKAKDHLVMRVYDEERMRDRLSQIPHEERGGLVVTYHLFYVTTGGHVYVSQAIDYDLLESYGVSEKELKKDAILCSLKNFPAKVMSLAETLGQEIEPSQEDVLVVTNTHGPGGASALFYPGMMEEIGRRIGGDYYVIPSSVHEMLVVAARDADPFRLRDMLREINREMVPGREQLSDHIFLYDAGEGALRRATP